jgi:predicted Zn-dependent peptidase
MSLQNLDPYDFSKKEIHNVPVYYKNLPQAPCIHINIVFNTGAFNDPTGKEGLSHLLEHLIFDGSPKFPNKKSVDEWAKTNTLNSWNAWTSFSNTNYHLKCLPEKYETALSGIKDMIFNSYFKQEDIEHEKKVIVQEIWSKLSNENYLKHKKEFVENIFHGHNHARFSNPFGWPETVTALSHEDVVNYHKKNYGIGNFFIVLAGAVENTHIEKLQKFLKGIPHVESAHEKNGTIEAPRQKRLTKTAAEIGKEKEQAEITILRVAEQRPYTETGLIETSRKLLYDILNERLRVEHGLCYGAHVSSSTSKTYSQFSVNVTTDEKNVDMVEKEFYTILQEIKNDIFVERFNLIKKLYIEQIRAQERLSSDIVEDVVSDIVKYNEHILTLEEELTQVMNVSYTDVKNFIAWIYDPKYIYTEIILPSKK